MAGPDGDYPGLEGSGAFYDAIKGLLGGTLQRFFL